MRTTCDEAEFEEMSWHDSHIWRLDFHVGDLTDEKFASNLVIGLDFIVEWSCALDEGPKFKIAPATLAFHGVTDARIGIGWGQSGFQSEMNLATIDQIHREPVTEQKVYLDRPYYRWQVLMNWPAGSEIVFGAFGFTQTLLAQPLLCEKQHLSHEVRSRLIGR